MSSNDDLEKPGNTIKFVLAGMFTLVGIAIFIIILQFYARYLLKRQERRRRTTLNALITTASASSEVVSHSIQLPKTGLDPLTIDSLPMFNYKANGFNHVEPIDCSVCLSTITEDAKVRLLPNCKHIFHVDCIDMWLGSHMNCPNCRTLAEPRPEREGSGLETAVQPTAPPLEETVQLEKTGGSCSRLSSFRRVLSRERPSRRTQSCGAELVGAGDLERQS